MLTETIDPQVKVAVPNLLPVVRELPADLETPVSVYLKLAGQGASFLLESVTGGEQLARYSFIGTNLEQAYVLRGGRLDHHSRAGVTSQSLAFGQDPLDFLRSELSRFRLAPPVWSAAPGAQPAYGMPRFAGGGMPRFAGGGMPRFAGGLLGYLGYDTIPYFEPSVPLAKSVPGTDDAACPPAAVFLLVDTLVAFDHAFGRMLLITNVHLDEGNDPAESLAAAELHLDELQARLAGPIPTIPPAAHARRSKLASNTRHAAFVRSVRKAKEYIAAGEIFQVVLSQRFARQTSARPFDIYRSLRRLNPSPYMFYFDFGGLAGGQPLQMIGASPEVHARLEAGLATMRPIAGTRPRGASPEEDQTLTDDLLADPKERAEHMMLVDLTRNDLGRVCEFGTVQVTELMGVEQYSHVMHIVSHVEGRLRPGLDGFDLLRATFPAGTVSGAPKIRAMQIIAELEPEKRGPYAGAVGYFSYDDSFDTCIAIRTLVMQGQRVDIQAGAGIVADSDPEREYVETLNKARALELAVELAEK